MVKDVAADIFVDPGYGNLDRISILHLFVPVNHTLEFDSLYLEFGHHRVLSNIYMKCQTGDVVGLLGRNGSGKSCLMKIVFGSMKAYHRSVRIDGLYYLGNTHSNSPISYLPQESLLPSYLTLREALNLYQVKPSLLVDYFPALNDQLDRKPDAFSGGYRRLAETLIVLKKPGWFCILDEPFTGLMPVYIERLTEIIKEESKVKGIIVTDHLYRHITELANPIYVLVSGQTYPIDDPKNLAAFGYLPPSEEDSSNNS